MTVSHVVRCIALAVTLIPLACGDPAESARVSQRTLAADSLNIYREFGQCTPPEAPCAWFRAVFPQFSAANDSLAADSINRFIRTWIGRQTVQAYDPDQPLEMVADSFTAVYASFLADNPTYKFGWMWQHTVGVVFAGGGILGLRHDFGGYTGGAHPNYSTFLANVEMISGRLLSWDDLLVDEARAAVALLAEKHIRRERGIPADTSFAEAGYFITEGAVPLPGNFIVTDSGLQLFYNAYEIAPYSKGPTHFTILYRDLRTYLDPDGPLAWAR